MTPAPPFMLLSWAEPGAAAQVNAKSLVKELLSSTFFKEFGRVLSEASFEPRAPVFLT